MILFWNGIKYMIDIKYIKTRAHAHTHIKKKKKIIKIDVGRIHTHKKNKIKKDNRY